MCFVKGVYFIEKNSSYMSIQILRHIPEAGSHGCSCMCLSCLALQSGEQTGILYFDRLRLGWEQLRLAAILTDFQTLSLKGRKILMMDFDFIFPSRIVEDLDLTANQFQADFVFLAVKADTACFVYPRVSVCRKASRQASISGKERGRLSVR